MQMRLIELTDLRRGVLRHLCASGQGCAVTRCQVWVTLSPTEGACVRVTWSDFIENVGLAPATASTTPASMVAMV